MKKIYSLILCLGLFAQAILAQDSTALKLQQLDTLFKYQHGSIKIGNGIGLIKVPAGFKYLDSVQAERVLTEIWRNPKAPNMTLGFILPDKQSVLDGNGYVFNIQYDALGYVKDDDADKIDYDELLSNLKTETQEENKERVKEGYPEIEMVGWAAQPYYDKNRRILHWAKEIKFGTDTFNTLNYNVRVLGRRGVLVLNAISTMNEFNLVKAGVPHVLNIVEFTEGNKYTDFDPEVDKVAAWTIGGLVAGKILAKVGFFALLLKFWKLLAVGVVAAGSAVKRFFTGKKAEVPQPTEEKDTIAEFDSLAVKEQNEEATETSEGNKD